MISTSSAVVFLLCLACIVSVSKQLQDEAFFQSDIPKGYFSRTNLDDCPARFHDRAFLNHCLVFGGERANATEFPHMAVIGWRDAKTDGGITWKCGGSLITERFVLTAAHCAFDENNQSPTVVRLGDVDLSSDEDDDFAQQFRIVRFVRHPEHRFAAKYNDIALIELDGTVNLTMGVCPACIWTDPNLPYETFDVAGFGATGYGEKSSPHLLKAYLKAENRSTCSAEFDSTRGLKNGITEQQLCASNIAMDTCQGDSGGPLQVGLSSYNRKVATLVGVTSFGRICGSGSFGVYQKVQPHLAWIRSVVKESLDPAECALKYKPYLVGNLVGPECRIGNPYISRVELLWAKDEQLSNCSGTLIDYNTVITSASCTLNSLGKELKFVRILEQTIPIKEILRHPDFVPGSIRNNVALIRLTLYLRKNEEIAPACLHTNPFDTGINSLRIAKSHPESKSQEFIRAPKRCDERMLSTMNINEHLDQDHTCWSTDYRMIPGLCEIDQGGPFLDHYHTTLHGINVQPGECGSSNNALITLNLKRYKPWIEAFVLDRSVTPEPPIVFQEEDNSSLFFKPCTTNNGTAGKCMNPTICYSEIVGHRRNGTNVTMCGFEDGFSYICCPNESIGNAAPLPRPPVLEILELELNKVELVEPYSKTRLT